MDAKKIIGMDEGWAFIQQECVQKLINSLNDQSELRISPDNYAKLYSTIYDMCCQKPPHDYCQQLYHKYRQTIEEYINSTVVPSLREKHDESLLRELVKRWENHKVMIKWLSRFFQYLDRFFIPRMEIPTLKQVGVTCFRNLVYKVVVAETRDVVISLINREREGEQVDRALLKNVLDVFVEVGKKMELYKRDFEEHMIKETAAYYSRKASNWIYQYSSQDYMHMVEVCLEVEKERVSQYLHSSTEPKLLARVVDELKAVYSDQLVEKPFSLIHI